ncbi:3-keto-5-aminohexanoate cleavage protein [Mariluticola halotolerans]|uniref:3-keto-5-aminohexanoate cleavage protein n=1 Tax=Mariluticola halotolerans TaxID=2909283 RepID=UPI0026E2E6A5|nr:3-keto-5-aminohexanoate cleavage protein [Mariluticola halotolerans]UJQ94854.1 3-keto-5-aminohexanoate cleavage protein [Mariluticola halotolerans]
MADKKVIITCAITGGIHTPSMSPYLPITPDEIAASAIEAADAGAAILHLHARDPENGAPASDPDLFAQFLPKINDATDAVINLTTGGGLTMTVEERLAGPLRFKPEMCSLNMGSMNFALHPLAEKKTDWKYDWEPAYLLGTKNGIFRNTFEDIEKIIERLGKDHGTRFEHECYDVGHLYNLAYFLDRKIIEPPFLIQTIFGVLGGMTAEWENLNFMKETADRLFGDAFEWSVLAAGRNQMPFVTNAASRGGHVRVGLEDSLYISRGVLAQSNAQQVRKVRKIIEELGLEIAKPNEVRQMLGLKGADLIDL